MTDTKNIIGRVEHIDFVDAGVKKLPIKVDTGAYRSSVWATKIYEINGELHFTLLGPKSEFYTGIELTTTEYRKVSVESSFGHKQERYSVFLQVEVGGKRIKSNFTLANRSRKTYPALIGRKLLKNRFLVDVSRGYPLVDEERNGDESLE